ncbi:hypothetical protein EZV62_028190 [Acer yangbiense]|uniref:Disease resistance protein winged helix domain-containing protein n=1 Tax=Acer yangbiense TaxID=1000413 RepID=A0A5C7GP32_9ROSI|nr:hypothetical protein EZV62_028190 [Acer yangbiense]
MAAEAIVSTVLEQLTSIIGREVEQKGAKNAQIPKKNVRFLFSSPCFCFRQIALRRDIVVKIKTINEKLDSIAIEKDKYDLNVIRSLEKPQRSKTTSFIEASEICGRDEEKNNLVNKLLSEKLEIIGEECFDTLAMHSFFQEFKKDYNGNIDKCKMHDIVHDFAQFVVKNECFSKEIYGGEEASLDVSCEKARHSMLILKSSYNVNISGVQKLRSLLIEGEHGSGMIEGEYGSGLMNSFSPDLFEQLTCLRAMKLSSWLQCAEHWRRTFCACLVSFCARLVSAGEFYPSKSSNSILYHMVSMPLTNNEMLSPRWMNDVVFVDEVMELVGVDVVRSRIDLSYRTKYIAKNAGIVGNVGIEKACNSSITF